MKSNRKVEKERERKTSKYVKKKERRKGGAEGGGEPKRGWAEKGKKVGKERRENVEISESEQS